MVIVVCVEATTTIPRGITNLREHPEATCSIRGSGANTMEPRRRILKLVRDRGR